MKILVSNVAIKDSPTGVFSRSFNLAKGLARKKNEVTFLTTQNKGFVFPYTKELRDGVTIIAVPSFFSYKIKKFGYDLLPILLKSVYVLFKRYDIVHSDLHRPTSLIPCVVHRFVRKSILISDWQDINGSLGLYKTKSKFWKLTAGPFDNWLELYSKKISDGIVVLSELLKKKSLELGITENKIYKLWGGSDLDKIKFVNSTVAHRKFFNIAKDDFVIVFIGLDSKDYKDNLSVFAAIKKISSSGIKMKIARTGKPFTECFKEKYSVGDEIIELGYVDDKDYGKLLSCANACMLMQEPNNVNNLARWPNVIGDYIAAGRPVIMNLMGELVELHKNIPNAIIEMKSIDEDYVIKMLTEIYKKRAVLHENYEKIFEYARTSFSWDIRAKELEEIYMSFKNQRV